jgi:hypothetical protein
MHSKNNPLDDLEPLVIIKNGKALCQFDNCSNPPHEKEAFCKYHIQAGEDRLKASLNGYEPPYRPQWWNRPGYQLVHNCFAYALNILSHVLADKCKKDKICNTHQPGEASHWIPMDEKTCPNLIARLYGDGKYSADGRYTEGQYIPVKYLERCPKGTSKIGFIIDTKRDYHVLVENDEEAGGYFSHKGGQGPATDRDAQGHRIADIRRANFNYSDKPDKLNYTHFCGYFCISRSVVHAAVPKGGRRYRGTRNAQGSFRKTRRVSFRVASLLPQTQKQTQKQTQTPQRRNKTRLLQKRNGK